MEDKDELKELSLKPEVMEVEKDKSQQKVIEKEVEKNPNKEEEKNQKKKKGNPLKVYKERKQYQRLNKVILNQIRRRFQIYNQILQKDQQYNKQGQSLRKISMHLNVSYSRLLQLWQKWHEDSTLMEFTLSLQPKGPKPITKRTQERKLIIESILGESRLLTRKQIANQIMRRQNMMNSSLDTGSQAVQNETKSNTNNVPISQDSVGRLLKRFGYKRKRVKIIPLQRNNVLNIQRRYGYCLKMKELIDNNSDIYYLDQSGFNLDLKREYGWGKKGEQVRLQVNFSKGKNISLIAMIGKTGVSFYETVVGNYNQNSYIEALTKLFQKFQFQPTKNCPNLDLKKDAPQNSPKKYIVMDNCRIHSKEYTEYIASHYNFQTVFLPPYSPQLNPIQNWFSVIKCRVRKQNFNTEKELMAVVQKHCSAFINSSFQNYYHSIQRYIELGINKVAF